MHPTTSVHCIPHYMSTFKVNLRVSSPTDVFIPGKEIKALEGHSQKSRDSLKESTKCGLKLLVSGIVSTVHTGCKVILVQVIRDKIHNHCSM